MSTSIRELYRYALAEGEGVGTAYEYYAKRRIIAPLVASLPRPARIVVVGLPEKYGTSLDFVLVAGQAHAELLIVDDREAAIARSEKAILAVGGARAMGVASLEHRRVSVEAMCESFPCDLWLSCEVLQRMPPGAQAAFVRAARASAPRGAIFVPNSANRSHLDRSGLAGFDAEGLTRLVGRGCDVDLVDMPPFPPGITRSAEQRESAKSGALEALAMRGLQAYCDAERFVPRAVKERIAHIVYARWR
jgi:hypothetical protein